MRNSALSVTVVILCLLGLSACQPEASFEGSAVQPVSEEVLDAALGKAIEMLLSLGLTGVHDPGNRGLLFMDGIRPNG